MSEASDTDDEKAIITDTEEIVQHRRLNRIFDIREELHELRSKILMRRHESELAATRFQALCGYRTLANNLLQEIEPLLHEFDGEELLEDRDFGTVYIDPNTEKINRDTWRISNPHQSYRVNEKPAKKAIDVNGLNTLWQLPDPLETTVEVMRFNPDTQIEEPVPIRIVDQISIEKTDEFVRAMNRYLSDIGFELTPDEANQTAESDYSDLI